jgi:hypothetical protein
MAVSLISCSLPDVGDTNGTVVTPTRNPFGSEAIDLKYDRCAAAEANILGNTVEKAEVDIQNFETQPSAAVRYMARARAKTIAR